MLTGKKGETVANSERPFAAAARKRPVGAKILHLGHYQNLTLTKMSRNLKVHTLNVNTLSHHAEYIFQVNRMPPFLLLIIKYLSKVCLVSRDLKERK